MRCERFLPVMGGRVVRSAVASGCLVLLFGAGGCSELEAPGKGGGRMTGWTQVRLPGTSRAAVFDAGVYALGQWFQVAETLPAEGLIVGATEEFEQKGGTGRIRDEAIGYRNRMRRTATVVIREQGTGCVAKCRVQVERLDTADHRVFRRNEQFGDVPNETPIDRDAGVSPRQDQVWTPVPRDRGLEREVLDLLRSRVMGEE